MIKAASLLSPSNPSSETYEAKSRRCKGKAISISDSAGLQEKSVTLLDNIDYFTADFSSVAELSVYLLRDLIGLEDGFQIWYRTLSFSKIMSL